MYKVQGDPLSPYLFILGQEVLPRMIKQEPAIKGVKASISGPAITHIMYADDIILFSKATRRDAAKINECLDKYCSWSGQKLNRNKSEYHQRISNFFKITSKLDCPVGEANAYHGQEPNIKLDMTGLYKETAKAASPIWKAIEGVKNIIVRGSCYRIGNGAGISVWHDPWVPWINGFRTLPKHGNVEQTPLMVSQLIDQESFAWKTSLIKDLFDPESAEAILSIHLPTTSRPDKLIWLQNPNRKFSVKLAYQLTTQIPPPPPPK
ncbi:hypothetical protein SO802_028356 [Lithocarpus litseifolius]|uniref:Reverse transcriptase domain-containing protein n=1 Tax=Lithocarpus litseifolius TaxID=425828 RepID=A0AAW2BSA7_9ROSI